MTEAQLLTLQKYMKTPQKPKNALEMKIDEAMGYLMKF